MKSRRGYVIRVDTGECEECLGCACAAISRPPCVHCTGQDHREPYPNVLDTQTGGVEVIKWCPPECSGCWCTNHNVCRHCLEGHHGPEPTEPALKRRLRVLQQEVKLAKQRNALRDSREDLIKVMKGLR